MEVLDLDRHFLINELWRWQDFLNDANFVFSQLLSIDDYVHELMFNDEIELHSDIREDLERLVLLWLKFAVEAWPSVSKLNS